MRWCYRALVGCLPVALGCVQVFGIEDLPGDDDEVDAGDTGGEVSVRFVRGPAPVEQIRVILHRADGSVAATALSDADGVAVVPFEIGGLVTVVLDEDGRFSLTTLTGLEPDDSLEIALEESTSDLVLTVAVAPNPPPTTSEILASSSCDAATVQPMATEVALQVSTPCLGTSDAFDVMLRARENNQTIAKSFVKNASPGMMAAASAWETNLVPFTWTVNGVTTDDLLGISEVVDGQNFGDNTQVISSMMNGNATDFVLELGTAPGFADFVTTFSCRGGVTNPCIPAAGGNSLLRIDLTTASGLTIDMDALGTVFTSVAHDPNTAEVSWTGSVTADYLRVTLEYTAAVKISWRIVTDSAARQVTLPQLPDELAGARFPMNGQLTELMIQGYDHSYASGYRDAIDQDLPHNELNQAFAYDRWPVREGSVTISTTSGLPIE